MSNVFVSVRSEEQCKCKEEKTAIQVKEKWGKGKQQLNLKCCPQDERFLLLMEK